MGARPGSRSGALVAGADGGSTTVPRLSFKAGVNVESTGPDEAGIRVRLELPVGLRWGFDLPDSSENCSNRHSAGGAAASPSGVTRSGSVGKSRLAGTRNAGSGVATCRYRTPRSAKGKILCGTVAFSAGGTQITRRFAVRLR